jgi:hypothetical protein
MGKRTRPFRLFLFLIPATVVLAAASPAATQTRLEDTNLLAIRYGGTWHTDVSLSYTGGTVFRATEAGATASVTFEGTGIRWIGFRDEWSGIASVSLDGAYVTNVDTYASPAEYQAAVYSIQGLPQGTHTLVIQALQTRNAASGGAWVWIDAFDVTSGEPTTFTPPDWTTSARTEQDSPDVILTGTWLTNTQPAVSGGTAVHALNREDRATFSFTGTGVRWIGYFDEWSGIGRVYLDGALVRILDTYATPSRAQEVAFTTSGLASGPHTIAIEPTHERNSNSGGRWVWVDAFDVLP